MLIPSYTKQFAKDLKKMLKRGKSDEQILDAHPRLTREAIQAALEFAADALRADVVYPIGERAA